MTTATDRFAPPQADSSDLQAYFADRGTLARNLGLLMAVNLGWSLVLTVLGPLMQLRMNECGIGPGTLGLISLTNSWTVSVLVMYFSWRSDHTVSRWGRRVPYIFVSAPFIIATVVLFPWYQSMFTLVTLYVVQLLFMDLKNSTFVLLPIDCVPRRILARTNSLFGIVGGLVSFSALHWGFAVGHLPAWAPYLAGAAIMLCTTASSAFIREPPIRSPASGPWRPWTSLAIGWKDRRNIVLMLGVGTVGAFNAMFWTWLWLFARSNLGMEKDAIGQAVSWSPLLTVTLAWPVGWLIDRVGGLRIVLASWLMQVVGFLLVWHARSQGELVVTALVVMAASMLGGAAGIMVFKSAPPKDVGSVTSSNAFLGNLLSGTMAGVSGYLVEGFAGSYRAAFVLGICVSTVGLGILAIHRCLLASDDQATAPQPGLAGT
jgi:Na+/melibiose symporter-like transporter